MAWSDLGVILRRGAPKEPALRSASDVADLLCVVNSLREVFARCIAQTRHGSWCQRPAMRNLLRFGASLLIGLILNFRN